MPPKGKRVVKSSSPTKTKPQKTTSLSSTQQKKSTPNNSAATPSNNSSTTNNKTSVKTKQEPNATTTTTTTPSSLAALPSPEDTTATPPDDSSSFPNNNNNNNAPNASSGIDEVLSEADQLLRAASEAQALGRLRNASTYLLLAHARLVGLGRRFDRSRIEIIDNADEKKNKIGDKLNENGGGTSSEGGKGTKAADNSTGAIDPLIQLGDQSNMSLLALPGGDSHHPNDTNNGGGNTAATANNNNNNEPMLFPHQTFHHMPDNGVAYVEHLARTAMELHHKRTGRGMQHDAMVEKQNAVTKAKQVEQEQIRLAARGLFATAKGFTGVNVATGSISAVGGGGETNSRGFEVMGPPTTRKRKATEAQLDTEEKNAMAKRKGGRGKKPPTLVMHTQYGKNSDVHDLMKGALLS